MSRPQRSFWGALFGGAPAHDRFSLEELTHLHSVLLRNPVVGDANREVVVEALRSIAELVIWGDQHDSSMVEYFLTENLLAHFNQILQQRSNRRGNVAMQVLQTLSILIQNLRTQQTVYYLFSNNHINEIVSMRFDFEDDEVLGYYVNLLKTISLKLNETTVQFFFREESTGASPRRRGGPAAAPGSPGGRPASFPLYTESIKFVNHRDPMVRTAVKTLTLNVYGIRLPAVQRFVASRPASAYFTQLAAYIAEQCQMLDRLLSSWDVTSPAAQGAVEGCLAEVEDLLSYCNDVLSTGVDQLRELLLDCLWQAFVGPVLFWPLIQEDVAAQHIVALTVGGGGSGSAGSAGSGGTGGGGAAVQRGGVGPLCSLYVFERLFMAVTDSKLLTQLVSALLGGGASGGGASPAPTPPGSRPCSPGDAPCGAAAEAATRWQLPQELLVRLQYSPVAYRQALLGMLRGSDAQVAAATVRVLGALLQNRAVAEEQLELIGLLPQRRRKQRQLMQQLVGDSSPLSSQVLDLAAPAAAAPAPAAGVLGEAAEQLRQQGDMSGLAQARQQDAAGGQPARSSPRACNGAGRSFGSSSSSGGESSRHSSPRNSVGGGIPPTVELCLEEGADGSFAVQLLARGEQQHDQQEQQQQPAQQQQDEARQHSQARPASPFRQQRQQQREAAAAEVAFCEVAAAVLSLLSSDLLPPVSLHTVSWLLHQLLSVGSVTGGPPLSGPQQAALAAAAARHRAALQAALQGRWADALAPMVAAEWGRSRLAVLRSRPGSVHAAVQTWMQAVLVQELRWQQGAGEGGSGGPDPAALAAKQAYLAVQGAVAVLQLQQALLEGDVPLAPLCPAVTDADVQRGEVKENAQIALRESQRMSCSVCFARGQERQACFAVEGLPALVKAGQPPDLGPLKPSVLQQVAAAAPVLLVADPGSSPETGLVLSVAPLMGALPAVDAKHGRWLHVQVRPPLRGLLKVLQASHPGNALLNLQKHLVSGHWVLAFPDADRAASAAQHAEEWAHKMRAVYCQLLQPLLAPGSEAGVGGTGAAAGPSPGVAAPEA